MSCQFFLYRPNFTLKKSAMGKINSQKTFIKKYRYGFNGKENDDDLGTQDYGFRIYNPALCKFLSVDPLTGEYPELTPYQFASNTPIQAIDLDGLEAFFIHGTTSSSDRWRNED